MCIHPIHAEVVIVSSVESPHWFAIDMTSRDVIETHSDAAERIDCIQFSPGLTYLIIYLLTYLVIYDAFVT